MQYIDIATAIVKTGKSDKTIRNWIKANNNRDGAVRRNGKTVEMAVNLLKKDYPFLEGKNTEKETDSFRNQKEAAQLSITAESIRIHEKELESKEKIIKTKDEQIKSLTQQKVKVVLFSTIFSLFFIFLVIISAWFLFTAYRKELLQHQADEIKSQSAIFDEKFKWVVGDYQSKIQRQNKKNQELTDGQIELQTQLAQKDARIEKLTDNLQELLKASLAKSIKAKEPIAKANTEGTSLKPEE